MRGPAQACHSSKQTPDELEEDEEPLATNAEEDELEVERDPEAEESVSSSSSVTFRSIKPPIREIKVRTLFRGGVVSS